MRRTRFQQETGVTLQRRTRPLPRRGTCASCWTRIFARFGNPGFSGRGPRAILQAGTGLERGMRQAIYALYDDATAEVTIHRIPYDYMSAAEKILNAGLSARFAGRLMEGR